MNIKINIILQFFVFFCFLAYLKADEVSCSIELSKESIEVFESIYTKICLTNLALDTKSERLPLKIVILKDNNEKEYFERIEPIVWNDQGLFKTNVLLSFNFGKGKYYFETPGNYQIKFFLGKNIVSNVVDLQVNEGALKNISLEDSDLYQKLHSKDFLIILNLYKNPIRSKRIIVKTEIATDLINRYPDSSLANFVRVCLKIHDFDKLYFSQGLQGSKEIYKELAEQIQDAISKYPEIDELYRTAMLKSATAFALARELNKAKSYLIIFENDDDLLAKKAEKILKEIEILENKNQ